MFATLPRRYVNFLTVGDALFIGVFDCKIEHINTTYCPPQIATHLKHLTRDPVVGISSVISASGKSEMALRKSAMEIRDYRPLSHTKFM